MAYSNWGAFVYRIENGKKERVKDNEDVGFNNENVFHAVLGSGNIRLCGYKNYPILIKINEDETITRIEMDSYIDEINSKEYEKSYSGTYDGYVFYADQYDGNMIDLDFKEPDGTEWEATCGYMYGAGWMDRNEE